jgi:hypothetical protein
MPVETTIEKARIAMESGNIHRAKEILRSSFGNYGFSPPLFRAYADVLLALNETTQAGRYLFFRSRDLKTSIRMLCLHFYPLMLGMDTRVSSEQCLPFAFPSYRHFLPFLSRS